VAANRRLKAARRGVTISPAAILYQGRFSEAKFPLAVRNTSPEVMALRGTLTPPAGVTAAKTGFVAGGGPGTSGESTMTLKADPPLPAGLLHKASVDWAATFKSEGKKDLKITGRHTIHIEPLNDCPAAPGPISVEGKLDEWPRLPHEVASVKPEYESTWSGPADGSMRFATAYDDEYLYIVLRVTDDEVMNPEGEKYWKSDAIELWFGRAGTGEAKPEKRKVLAMFAEGEVGDLPEGAVAAVSRTTSGYAMEMAIPMDTVKEIAGDDWRRFRLNLCQFDLDADGVTQLWWRESWANKATQYPDSGTFQKKP